MAYIYKITNEINNKCYIGKTNYSDPKIRWKEHTRGKNLKKPLYRAMRKYGVENFSFDVIEETDNECEREKYWISHYNSYGRSGYNATLGGDGKAYLNHHKIIDDYENVQEIKQVARINNCSQEQVYNILKQNNVNIKTSYKVLQVKYGKKVGMIDLDTSEILMEFISQMEAAKYLIQNGLSKVRNAQKLSSHISDVCKNKRQTCAGFKWVRM